MAEKIIPWKGISTNAANIDELISKIVISAQEGITRYATSLTGYANGYSGFCFKSKYGGSSGSTYITSGVLCVPADKVYIYHCEDDGNGNVSLKKKASLSWV